MDEDYFSYTYDDPNDFQPPQTRPPDTRTHFQPRLQQEVTGIMKSNRNGEPLKNFVGTYDPTSGILI